MKVHVNVLKEAFDIMNRLSPDTASKDTLDKLLEARKNESINVDKIPEVMHRIFRYDMETYGDKFKEEFNSLVDLNNYREYSPFTDETNFIHELAKRTPKEVWDIPSVTSFFRKNHEYDDNTKECAIKILDEVISNWNGEYKISGRENGILSITLSKDNRNKYVVRLLANPDNDNYIGLVNETKGGSCYFKGLGNAKETNKYIKITPDIAALPFKTFVCGDFDELNKLNNKSGFFSIRTNIYHKNVSNDTELIMNSPGNRVIRTVFMKEPSLALSSLGDAVNEARENLKKDIDIPAIVKDCAEIIESNSSNKILMSLRQGSFSNLESESRISEDPQVANFQREMIKETTSLMLSLKETDGINPKDIILDHENGGDMTGIYEEWDKEYDLFADKFLGRADVQGTFDFNDGSNDISGVNSYDKGKIKISPSNVKNYVDVENLSTARIFTNLSFFFKTAGLDVNKNVCEDDEFFKRNYSEKTVQFDPSSVKGIAQLDAEGHTFLSDVLKTMVNTAQNFSCKVSGIGIDDKGIVRIQGTRNKGVKKKEEPFLFDIGQIFEPDKNRLVTTKFNSDRNYKFVAGYTGRFSSYDKNKPFHERIKLTSYEQDIMDAVKTGLRGMLTTDDGSVELYSGSSLNYVYRSLYDERLDMEFDSDKQTESYIYDYKKGTYLPEEATKYKETICKFLSGRVKFNDLFENSVGCLASLQYKFKNEEKRNLDEESFEPFINILDTFPEGFTSSVGSKEGDGVFDWRVKGSAKNQNSVFYLVDGAKVDPRGNVTPSDIPNDENAIMKLPVLKNSEYDAWNRMQMGYNTVLHQRNMSLNAGCAYVCLAGYNMDDGMVISKDFAEMVGTINPEGNKESIHVGDKISDFHGNKGVVNLIVDRNETDESIKARSINDYDCELNIKIRDFFKDNPDCQIAASPFALMSRANGGSVRDFQITASPLKVDGKVIPGGLVYNNFSITHRTAKESTNDEYDILEGKGRHLSLQFFDGMTAFGCDNFIKKTFGRVYSFKKIKSALFPLGYGITSDGSLYEYFNGNIVSGEDIPQVDIKFEGYERRSKETNEVLYYSSNTGDTAVFKGLPTYNMTGIARGVMSESYNKDIFVKLPFNLKVSGFNDDFSLSKTDDGKFLLPVPSSKTRRSTKLEDGSLNISDTTLLYTSIIKNGAMYELAGKIENSEIRKTVQDKYMKNALREYNTLINLHIRENFPNNKNNIIRKEVLNVLAPNSATAVQTAKPSLALDEMAMSEKMAKQLGINLGDNPQRSDKVLAWRDPIIDMGGIRVFRVRIDNSLTGVAINPASAHCFGGDFDGDQLGLMGFDKTDEKELMEKLSFSQNMVDKAKTPDENGKLPLYFNTSLDVAVGEYEKGESPLLEFVKTHDCVGKKDLDELTGIIQDDLKESLFKAPMNFENAKEIIRSMKYQVDSGAKGSYNKIFYASKFIGITQDKETKEFSFTDGPLVTRKDQENIQLATAVKTDLTAFAGDQRSVWFSSLRDKCPKEVLYITPALTQGVLDMKHNVDKCEYMSKVLLKELSKFRTGKIGDEEMTKETFVSGMKEILTNLDIDVNEEHIKKIADACTSVDETGVTTFTGVGNLKRLPLDVLSTKSNINTWTLFVKHNINIYDGKSGKNIAPFFIQKQSEDLSDIKDESVKNILQKLLMNDSAPNPNREVDVKELKEKSLNGFIVENKDSIQRQTEEVPKEESKGDPEFLAMLDFYEDHVGEEQSEGSSGGNGDGPDF